MKKLLFLLLGLTISSINLSAGESEVQRDQCGDLNHLSIFAPLYFDRDSLSREQFEYYGKMAFKTLKALVSFSINAHAQKKRLNFNNPKVKLLFKEMEDALECRNFKEWTKHVKQKFESEPAMVLHRRFESLMNELGMLFEEAFVLEEGPNKQCGSPHQLQKLGDQVLSLFGREHFSAKKEARFKMSTLNVANAMLTFMINSSGQPTTMKSPHVKQLFRELGVALHCSNFKGWIKHIESTYNSEKTEDLLKRFKDLGHDYFVFFGDAVIMD